MNLHNIRKNSFNKNIPYDNQLNDFCEGLVSHKFLCNPTCQYTYQYLVDFVFSASEYIFKKPIKSIKILDWGAGKGHISYLLKSHNANFLSADINDNSDDSTFGQNIPIIKNANIKVIPLNHPYLLPFEDNSFDVILSFGVLEHVPNEKESISEIHRVLKENGLFFCFFLPQTYSWTQKISHMRGNFYHDRLYNEKIVKINLENKFTILDSWSRALFPKNTIKYPFYKKIEKLDQFLSENTFLGTFATNFEFIAQKNTI